MEFAPSQIARLVLGYLKAEKCHTAFDTFFNTSPHFEYNGSNKRAKYIVTRIHGSSLRDFLNEYAQIYNLVQERLEPTDYYEECSSRNVVDQLTYLLDKYCYTRQNTPQRSRSSTPINETKNRILFQQNLSVIEEHASSELNTTPLEELPGNSHDFNHNPVRRTGIKTNKNTAVEESDSGDSPDNGQEEVEDIEVLKQTLLEHTELHEKIAENINLVIKTTETNKVAEEKLSHELDSAIKAIVERTEADPIFERLIGDLIGSAEQSDATDRRYSEEADPHSSPSIQLSSNIQQVSNRDSGNESDPIKQQLRNPRRPSCDKPIENTSSAPIQLTNKTPPLGQPQTTNENIPKVDNAMPITTITTPVDVRKNLTVNTNTGDVILYDGTLDNYMKTAPIVTSTNPIFFNNNLLMVQPGLIQSTPMGTSLVNGNPTDKSYYLLNSNPQLINVSVPQYKVNNVTEQDILNMPTVIVCDDNRQAVPNRSTKSTAKELPKLLPKVHPEPNIREYLTLYQCTDEQSQSTVVPPKSKVQSQAQKKDPPKTQTIQIEILKPIEKDVKEPPPIKEESEEAKLDVSDKASSPRPVTPDLTKQTIRKTTPKSGSHVRALDFNLTPGHGSLTTKKTSSPKSAKKKSPSKVPSTKISKSLFGSPSKSVKLENNELKNDCKVEDKAINKKNGAKDKKLASWDSDLRAIMGPIKEPSPPKKKKKESGKTSSKKPKANLNKTETDAKAIEENLKNMFVETTELHLKSETDNHGEENMEGIKDTKEDGHEEIKTVPINQAEEYDDQSVLTFTLINCNAKSRCKKKCNIDNSISKAVKITKVKEIKSLELVPDSSNKLILSPSKLNANKRTLVDNVENIDKEVDPTVDLHTVPTREIVENKMLSNDVKQDKLSTNDENETLISNMTSKEVEKTEQIESKSDKKFITPDMLRHHSALPVTANCNLTPMLETPIKYLETPIKLSELPKTPGANIPNNDTITPMTKMLNEQLHGIDLLSIQTPKFPLTPSFPITPFNTKSPYPNRSTDYSTTSSYYQPSDSEQNKSLEALMEECRRLETKVLSPAKEVNVTQDEVQIYPLISEKISTFNHNLIARKNLNLVKKDLENSSSDESTSSEEDSSSCSEDDTNSSGSNWDNAKNETVIQKRAETPYMLRSRTKEDRMSFEKDENVHDILSHTEVKPELDKPLAINSKEAILKEVEEKRKRTIAKFKQGEKPAPPPRKKQTTIKKVVVPQKKGTPLRDVHGKFTGSVKNSKRKAPNSNPTTTPNVKASKPTSTNKRKSKSPVKLLQKINDTISKDIMLHISSDDDEINPSDVVETLLAESEPSSVGSHPLNTFQKALNTFKSSLKSKEGNDVTSDVEATSLVEGLKERGIYLVPNKTPRKTDKPIDGDNKNTQGNKSLMKINKEETETIQKPEIIAQVTGEYSKLSQEKTAKIQNKKTLFKTDVKKKVKDMPLKDESSKNTKTAKTKSLEDNKPTKGKDKTDSSTNIVSSVIKELTIESKISNKAVSNSLDTTKSKDVKSVSHVDGELRSDEESKAKSSKPELKSKGRKRTQSTTKSHQTKKTEPKKTSSKTPRKEPSKLKDKDKDKFNSSEDKKQNEKEELKEQNIMEDNNSTPLDNLEKIAVLVKIAEVQILPAPLPIPSAGNAAGTIEQDLNLTDSVGEEVFDDMTFSEETITLVYDPQRASNKKIEDYNLPIADKCFVVEVFGEQIEMSMTPLEILLDLPRKVPKDKIKILQNTLISKGKDISPLNRLYEHLTLSSSNVNPISPLNNLYSDVNSAHYPTKKVQRLKTIEKRRNSLDHKREPTTKSRKTTRSKSVDYNSLSTSPKDMLNQDVHKPKSEKADASSDMTITREKSSDSRGKSSTKNLDKKDKPLDPNNKDTVIKDVIGESPATKRSPGGIDDELMNYAICGSERVENDIEDKGRTNKRKATDNIDHRQLKKIKCQEILKTMNVDEFLTHLHGES